MFLRERLDLMDYKILSELLFPDVTGTTQQLEEQYPQRQLPSGAVVSRAAPSPTGFVHLGNLIQALTSERLCHQSGGILFLRIEDTDSKREVKGAVQTIIESLKHYNIIFDEGATIDGDNGIYGPYRQRQRKDIYHIYAKKLVSEGKAYPCFCTPEQLEEIRQQQKEQKANLGYYGKWAIWRDRPIEEIKQNLKEQKPWVLRFRSQGSIENKFKFTDLIKGELLLPENDIDHVLLKSDGIPTYHFAHAVDDHLMRTTHVVRGDEWLSSLPFHIQLFKALDFKPPKYLHIGPLMTMEGNSKRKLSKRKDPAFALSYFKSEGFPVDSVYEYLLTILNSNFEDFRMANKDTPACEFKFSYKKMNPAGSLYDEAKLLDVSKNVISKMTAEEVYHLVLNWAKEYDSQFYKLLAENADYSKGIFEIGRGGKKPRKDIAKWSEVKDYCNYFFDELFSPQLDFPENYKKDDIKAILKAYLKVYNENDDHQTWFSRIKEICPKLGFSPDVKAYKQSPENFKGHVGDVSTVIRVALTDRVNTPDLYEIMKLLGYDRVTGRINNVLNSLN